MPSVLDFTTRGSSDGRPALNEAGDRLTGGAGNPPQANDIVVLEDESGFQRFRVIGSAADPQSGSWSAEVELQFAAMKRGQGLQGWSDAEFETFQYELATQPSLVDLPAGVRSSTAQYAIGGPGWPMSSGNSVEWHDFDASTVHGWKRDIPRPGDYLVARLSNGAWAQYLIDSVVAPGNPRDYFEGHIVPLGYIGDVSLPKPGRGVAFQPRQAENPFASPGYG